MKVLYSLQFLMVFISASLSQNISQDELNLIDDVLSSKISSNNKELNESVVLNYLYGNNSDFNQENNTDNLDFSMLDAETVKQIYESAHQKNFIAESKLNKTSLRYYKKTFEAFFPVQFFINKSMELMEQSIYSTRYRLGDTRALRKKYSEDYCYNIAIFYGSLMQLRLKIDNVYATMAKLPYNIKFLWFLGLYERCVAIHVDVHYMVEKMFSLYEKHKKLMNRDSSENIAPPGMTFGKGP